MQNENTLLDGKFKDESPVKTVEKITNILKSIGVELEETWRESGVPYCHSMSVKIKGGSLRSNGKGLTPEFARASGYAELMERLQMGFTGNPDAQKDGDFGANENRYELLPAREMLEKNRRWYELYSDRLYECTGLRMSPESIIMQYANAEGLVSATPYCNAATGEKQYLPTVLRKRVYTTSGCASGNTIEEAIVQAISEIVERNHQLRAISEGLCLPDVPEEVLQKYKAAYKTITFLRSSGYKVAVKDCSLGTKFPVACVCIIDGKTGRYHTHFGAYPIFEIALQRSLTESFQGRSLDNIGTFEDFLHQTDSLSDMTNFLMELTRGTGKKTVGFFVGQPSYPFNENMGFKGTNNRQLLRECIDFITEQGYDVLVRNRSCLGFPTVQVLVPGYSEYYAARISKQKDEQRYSAFARKALRNPSAASMQDFLGLLMHANEVRSIKSRSLASQNFISGTKLAATVPVQQEDYLMTASMAYAYYQLGRYNDVVKCISSLIPATKGEDAEYLICLKRYLTLLLDGRSKENITQIMKCFHNSKTVERLDRVLSAGKNPMEDFTLHCDGSCTESCILYKDCRQKFATQLANLINEKSDALNFDEFSQQLRQLLSV